MIQPNAIMVRRVVGVGGWFVSVAIQAVRSLQPGTGFRDSIGLWIWTTLFGFAFSALAVSRQRLDDALSVGALVALGVAVLVSLGRLPAAVTGTLVFAAVIASVGVQLAEWNDETTRGVLIGGVMVLPFVVLLVSLKLA